MNNLPNVLYSVDLTNKSKPFLTCDDYLTRFSNLEPRDKRKLGSEFLDLVDRNIKEASDLYFLFMELFDTDLKLQLCKQEFEEAYKGDLAEIKKQKILPIKIKQLESSIKVFQDLSENEQKKYAQLFNEICEMSPKDVMISLISMKI